MIVTLIMISLMVVMMIVTLTMISLMVVPTRVTAALANRIREEEEREGVVQEVMQICHIFHIDNSISNSF